jgi:hypothetical protein
MKFDNLFSSQDICLATGEGFADALTGTAYAAKKGMPIVLVNVNPPSYTRIYTVIKLNMANSIKGIPYVFGGTAVVPEASIASLYTLPSTDQPSKPSAPTNLVATAISNSEITIQWDQVSGADYYYVYNSDNGSSFKYYINKDGSQIQYKWLPVHSSGIYEIPSNFTKYFKVTAVKNGFESDESNIASATTLSYVVPVAPPVTPIIYPTPITSGVIESRINGTFEGWTGDTIFKLLNGQIWQQSSYDWTWHWAYSPNVLIYKSGSVYKMKVDGVDRTINVIRLK